jgi:hypothetical protein
MAIARLVPSQQGASYILGAGEVSESRGQFRGPRRIASYEQLLGWNISHHPSNLLEWC